MTTIAYDGRFVCSDSLQGSGSYNEATPAIKLRIDGAKVYAITGFFSWFDAWIDWHKSGANPNDTPVYKGGNSESTFIVFEAGRCFMYTHELPYADEQYAPCAFGSGWKYAVGVMQHGGSAREAVEICTKIDPHSGGPVQVIDLHEIQKIEKAA